MMESSNRCIILVVGVEIKEDDAEAVFEKTLAKNFQI